MLFLVDSLLAPPRAANLRRLNCLPDGVTCRYAAYSLTTSLPSPFAR